MRKTAELTCREVTDFLASYLDDELRPDDRQVFEDHLAVCPDCRIYLDQYAGTQLLASAALDDDAREAGVPEDLVQAILAARPAAAAPTVARPRPSRRR